MENGGDTGGPTRPDADLPANESVSDPVTSPQLTRVIRLSDTPTQPVYLWRSWWPFSRPPRSGPRTVSLDNVRARIAYALLVIFASTVGLIFVAVALHWMTPSSVKDLITPIITAEVSLLGAATGFYYGTSSSTPPQLGAPISAKKDVDT